MDAIRITFAPGREMRRAVAINGAETALQIEAGEGGVICRIAYDAHREPLCVAAGAGKAAELILLPHRVELYMDGRLADEEWPMGRCLFDGSQAIEGKLQATVSEFREEKRAQPAVLYTFEDAEGWQPEENVFVGDCMPYRRDDEYHVLYLKDRRHHKSKWGMGAHQWAHISTGDMVHWNVHPMAVEITHPEEGSICTGSWIHCGDKEYLYYTIRRGGGQPAPICRSVSTDGVHFAKDEGFGFTLPARYDAPSARDPKVLRDADGLYHMLLTTSLAEEGKGCLAHLISRDAQVWEDSGAPIYISATADQPECPDYIAYGGRYYLIFSLRAQAHYLYSDRPFDGWRQPVNDRIPCHSVPKGAVWEDRILFAGFKPVEGYAGSMTFCAARADAQGELVFEQGIVKGAEV